MLTDAALDRAVTNMLTEMFRLGMFDDPYRDPTNADAVAANAADQVSAARTLPLTSEKLAGNKIYAEAFHKLPEQAEDATAELKELLAELALADTPQQADIAILLLDPSSGEYFNATPGYLELDLCDGKVVPNVDSEGRSFYQ